jgi:hypothetical protein
MAFRMEQLPEMKATRLGGVVPWVQLRMRSFALGELLPPLLLRLHQRFSLHIQISYAFCRGAPSTTY